MIGEVWGLEAPDNALVSWGARGIFTQAQIDLLGNRQGLRGGADPEVARAFFVELNSRVMPVMRRNYKLAVEVGALSPTSSDDVVLYDDGIVFLANPRRSYGYVYVVAWLSEGASCKPRATVPRLGTRQVYELGRLVFRGGAGIVDPRTLPGLLDRGLVHHVGGRHHAPTPEGARWFLSCGS